MKNCLYSNYQKALSMEEVKRGGGLKIFCNSKNMYANDAVGRVIKVTFPDENFMTYEYHDSTLTM